MLTASILCYGNVQLPILSACESFHSNWSSLSWNIWIFFYFPANDVTSTMDSAWKTSFGDFVMQISIRISLLKLFYRLTDCSLFKSSMLRFLKRQRLWLPSKAFFALLILRDFSQHLLFMAWIQRSKLLNSSRYAIKAPPLEVSFFVVSDRKLWI